MNATGHVSHAAAAAATGTGSVLDYCPDGLVLMDEHGIITDANRRAIELLRCNLPTLAGVDFWEVLPEALADKYQREGTRRVASTGSYTFLDSDPFEGRWIEYGITRHADVWAVSIRNVTDRHKLMRQLRDGEQRTQALFESNPNVMWVFDRQTLQVLAANTAALGFYQYDATEFLSFAAQKLYASEQAADVRSSVPALDDDKPTRGATRVCKHRTKNGQVVVVEVAGEPIEWAGQRAILVTVANITARYAADAQLHQENVELERQLRLQELELAEARQESASLHYALSHDLLAPLHTADGFARTLVNHCGALLDEQGQHYLGRIQASVTQMSLLLEDLKLLSRVSRGTLNLQPIDLAPICRNIVEQLRKQHPGREVELEIEPTLPCFGDSTLLAAALAALLNNAWKFTSKKPQAWIRVAFVSARDSAERVLCVADNGAGFDEVYAHKLFGNFQRLHSSADFPGTGLGLAIVKRIVTRHGGRVWADSATAAGASFYIALPHPARRVG